MTAIQKFFTWFLGIWPNENLAIRKAALIPGQDKPTKRYDKSYFGKHGIELSRRLGCLQNIRELAF